VADAWDNQVVKVSPEGRVLNKTWVKKLHGKLALDHDGNVWVTQLDPPNTVTKVSPDGKVLGSFEVGTAALDLTIDAAGNVWVIGRNDLRVLSPDGATRKVLKEGQYGTSIASDTAGRIWITTENKGVRQLSADGKMRFETEIPDGEARDVAIDPEGNAWVYAIPKHAGLPNKANAWVSKVSPEGQILARYDVGNGDGELAFAPDGHLWITLYDQNTVVKLGPDGAQLATYYTGVGPSGIAFDASGQAWVTNHYSHLLKKVTP
jgi:streptogramin lyase